MLRKVLLSATILAILSCGGDQVKVDLNELTSKYRTVLFYTAEQAPNTSTSRFAVSNQWSNLVDEYVGEIAFLKALGSGHSFNSASPVSLLVVLDTNSLEEARALRREVETTSFLNIWQRRSSLHLHPRGAGREFLNQNYVALVKEKRSRAFLQASAGTKDTILSKEARSLAQTAPTVITRNHWVLHPGEFHTLRVFGFSSTLDLSRLFWEGSYYELLDRGSESNVILAAPIPNDAIEGGYNWNSW